MKKKEIEQKWKMYRKQFIPKKLGESLVGEMREAFFAGAATAFLMIVNAPDFGDGNALDLITDMYEEVQDFGRRLDERHIGPEIGGEH